MISLSTTLKQIADIISFSSDTFKLRDTLIKETIDWNAIVKVASHHLVLPTIYCRLKQKSLLDIIPTDLKEYLTELTFLNRNRNQSLLTEIQHVSELFNQHEINHVFLKGAALLASNYYKDLGERMIGDIDILVDSQDLKKAFNLLSAKNYTAKTETLGQRHFEQKHLPRLIPETETGLGAIELHKKLLSKPHFNALHPISVLESKQLQNGIYIPSALYMLRHNALNFQINDKAYIHTMIGLRSAYDGILLLKQNPEINFKNELSDPYYKKYMLLISVFFKDIPSFHSTYKNRLQKRFFIFTLKHNKFKMVWETIINYYLYSIILLKRTFLFLVSSSYRNDLLKDRHRILKIINEK